MDPIALLKEIKAITFKFEEQKYICHSLHMAYRNFYTFKQLPETSNTKYLEQFNNLVDIVIQHSGCLGLDETLME